MKNIILLFVLSFAFLSQAVAQEEGNKSQSISKAVGLYVFPANDQDKETQEYDEFKCYKWAVEESGVDPINPPDVEAEATPTGPDGSAVRGAARGAAVGAAIGAISGDAGKGAAIGATAG